MTTEEKFNAAVNVIRSLPKNGSYQPSTDLMLRFYGFYKQATQGPCTGPKPPFWDAVGRAKYNAWQKNGDMSRTEAMGKYVDELHKIVETMSYTDNVANFLEASTDELDTVNMDDLELIVGDVLERVRSQPNSPLASREASPHRLHSSLSTSPSRSSIQEVSDHSDEEYIDTVDDPRKTIPNGTAFAEAQSTGGGKRQHKPRGKSKFANQEPVVDVSQEISKTVQNLKVDLEKLTNRINTIENASKVPQRSKLSFSNAKPEFLALIFLWPFLASYILHKILTK